MNWNIHYVNRNALSLAFDYRDPSQNFVKTAVRLGRFSYVRDTVGIIRINTVWLKVI